MAERELEMAEQEAARYRPPWMLRGLDRFTYVLTNGGGETAYDVWVSAVDPDLQLSQQPTGADVTPGEARSFSAIVFAELSELTVEVRWRRSPDGEVLRWRHPLM